MVEPIILTKLPEFLKLVAHDIRWQMLVALGQSDMRVSELVDLTGEKMNLLSYHLKKLREANLVSMRRSEADGRDVYYSLNLEYLQTSFVQTVELLTPSLLNDAVKGVIEDGGNVRVLFVCTYNAARSQMAEGIMRQVATELDYPIEVFSAGTQPTKVHPDAVRALLEMDIDISQQQSASVVEYQDQRFDYVITLCDIAREVCPDFNGGEIRLHWGFSDPSDKTDSEALAEAFREMATNLDKRIRHFANSLYQT